VGVTKNISDHKLSLQFTTNRMQDPMTQAYESEGFCILGYVTQSFLYNEIGQHNVGFEGLTAMIIK
jgi:hypothetical protein